MGSFMADDAAVPSTSTSHRTTHMQSPRRHSGNNVFHLLSQREISPQTKRSSKKLWGNPSKSLESFGPKRVAERDARRDLISWLETESLCHLSAKYCPLLPPPRSTIAAAFSSDGKTLASTHGDHTVKIIDCRTGNCLKVLSGHRRTPWVVRYHPLHSEILASGSLDHEVRLWDANTAMCIGSRDFYRPIASIAFHAQGELLAVASGYKLYMWHYNRKGDTSAPTIVLRTRRSLRAVHFHPHGAPYILTAEVNDLDTSDPTMTIATSTGYLCYPPPTVYMAKPQPVDHSSMSDSLPLMSLPILVWPPVSRDDNRLPSHHNDENGSTAGVQQRVEPLGSVRLMTYSTPSGQYELLLSPVEPDLSSSVQEETGRSISLNGAQNTISLTAMDVDTSGTQPAYFIDPGHTYWELPFLQGWLAGQSLALQNSTRPMSNVIFESSTAFGDSATPSANVGQTRDVERSSLRHQSSRSRQGSSSCFVDAAPSNNVTQDESNPPPIVNRIQSEIATSLAVAAAAELPCTVKLRIWPHDIKEPCALLDPKKCRLTIPHAVLCSEMGTHFSPCGRFLAACVACIAPQLESDPGIHSQVHHNPTGTATSPTRHPISTNHVMYELRIYSLEETTFGHVLSSRAIRAAHCLTSIQFSPTSEHLLLAYGRRHSSLLKSVVIDGETIVSIYSILEIYRVSDMELVRVLPSADDEVNVACFHPSVGGGIVYGTKEGKLRILQCDPSYGTTSTTSISHDVSMLEVPTYALEC
uniref:Transducin family protein / WD-40 repeat family protein n=1 Tax=Kalanchoe fedtschenkoi TaxID=63787 RepID=A0A7N0TUN9_KALFE